MFVFLIYTMPKHATSQPDLFINESPQGLPPTEKSRKAAHRSKKNNVVFDTAAFIGGTYTMTNEQVGVYIRLLCAQCQEGGYIDTALLTETCSSIQGGHKVMAKFKHTAQGKSYNARMLRAIDNAAKAVSRKRQSTLFTPPSHQEVAEYFKLKTKEGDALANEFASQFIAHYTLKDWHYGRGSSKIKLKDWKKAFNTWGLQGWIDRNKPKKWATGGSQPKGLTGDGILDKVLGGG